MRGREASKEAQWSCAVSNWDHIPGVALGIYYLRTLIIEKEEWAHLSNPASLTQYWEPTQVAQSIQYSMETAGLTKYRNDRVLGLRGAPNTDDHSAYLSEVKKESWSYPAKGNLSTVRQFIKELEGCPDADKRLLADKTLREKGMPEIPQENTLKGGKQATDQGPLCDESAPEHRGGDNRHQAS